MPDLVDTRGPSGPVWEATLRAEAAAGITRDAEGNEVYSDADTPTATPELEGAVPVPASDQPLTPEEPVVAPPEPADTSEEQQQEAEPQSVESLQAELTRLQEQLEAKDSFIGRQSTEIGDLRTAVDEVRAAQQQAQQTPAAPQVPLAPITQDEIDLDPSGATLRAFEIAKATGNEDDPVLNRAFIAWREEDPFTASQWLTDRRLEAERAEFDAKLQEMQAQIQTATAPLAKSAEDAEWSGAFVEMQKAHPDFLTVDEATGKTTALRLLEDVAPQYPATMKLIAEGDAAVKVEGLKLLYEMGKLGTPEKVQQELQTAAEEAAAEAAAARAAAGVVAGQANAGQGSEVEQTYEQQEQEAYKSRLGSKPSLSRGWTGRA